MWLLTTSYTTRDILLPSLTLVLSSGPGTDELLNQIGEKGLLLLLLLLAAAVVDWIGTACTALANERRAAVRGRWKEVSLKVERRACERLNGRSVLDGMV